VLAVLGAALTVITALAAAGPAAAREPGAVVVLGDSAASGEGAGDYAPGTRGEGGNWCHRSAGAYAHRTGLPGPSVNLACSGARAADVAFGGAGRYGEGSQAQRLQELAAGEPVAVVVVQVGANDEPATFDTGVGCVRAFLDPRVPGCRETVGPQWPGRVAAMAPRVAAALADVRTALARTGNGGATVVLASYAAPVTERMVGVPAVEGCPYSRADAGWARTQAFPQLSDALAGVAATAGVRFLDLSRATEGREACSRPLARDEWQRRVTVDPEALVHGGLDAIGVHLAQESFHPSAAGHAQLGRCLGEFLGDGAAAAACVVGDDGLLHARPAGAAAPSAA
jgi:lysophospholipase L1-like esterase